MNTLAHYGASLALLTDLYQLTMAYGYWQQGMHEQEAVFHLTFRKSPFGGGYAVVCGTETAVDYLERLQFDESDADYLRTLEGNDGARLFQPAFIDYLQDMRFRCDVDVMPEGSIAFPHEPLVRVRGPLLQAQLVETPLLTIVNFQTLVATKSSRVCRAAGDGAVLEFGLRRAQGVDGGLTASRAAYVGGCAATSNVMAGKLFNIPVKGTHAHSWVMAFDDELEAFRAYADSMPNNSLFLVDTYDTVEGVRKAVTVGRELQAKGHKMLGIRLDSGDLGQLSIAARVILDKGGFPDAMIVASNDLDEYAIERLLKANAAITVWGVGTKLATCYDQPALGGVYKLGAIRPSAESPWRPTIKLSEQPIKISNPTAQQVRRVWHEETMVGDVIYTDGQPPEGSEAILADGTTVELDGTQTADLLTPALRRGGRVASAGPAADGSLSAARDRCRQQLDQLPPGVLALSDPTPYPVALSPALHDLKQQMIAEAQD